MVSTLQPLRPIGSIANTDVKVLFNRAKMNLTDRELECAKLVAHGFTNPEIGTKLGIAEVTVKVHLRNAMSKLFVRDRTRLAVYCIKAGLVRVDDVCFE